VRPRQENWHSAASKHTMKHRPELPWRRRIVTRTPRADQLRPPRSRWTAALKVWSVAAALAAGTGWLVVNWPAAERAWEWWRTNQSYTGRWTNDAEGFLGATPWAGKDGETVLMALHVRGGEVTGDIHTQKLCDLMPYNSVGLEGHTRLWGLAGARVYAWDYVHGEKRYFAKFTLERNWREGTLYINDVEGAPILPDRAELVRLSEDDGGTVLQGDRAVQALCPHYWNNAIGAMRSASGSSPAASAPRTRHSTGKQ
jgi:hypothetical protein